MALPIVSGSEVQTPIGGTKINGEAFRQAALAPGRLAQAIGQDVGGLFEDVGMKVQQNRNAQQVFKADLAMRKTKDEFDANLAKMPDPGTWLPAWKQQVDQQREAVLNSPHAGPDVKRHLNMMFDTWEQATTSAIKIQATRKQVADMRQDGISDSTYAYHQGELDAGDNILKATVENHGMSMPEARKLMIAGQNVAAKSKADQMISADPIKAEEAIKNDRFIKKNIDPVSYESILGVAHERRKQAQSDNYNTQRERLQNGSIKKEELDDMVKKGEMTQTMADGLMSVQKKEFAEHDKETFDQAQLTIQAHDWADDKTPQETANKIRGLFPITNGALQFRVNDQLEKALKVAKKEGEKEEHPAKAVAFKAGEEAYAVGLFRPASEQYVVKHNTFWFDKKGERPTDPEPDHEWKNKATSDEIKTARIAWADYNDKMTQWLATQDPKAPDLQMRTEEYAQKLIRPHVMAHVDEAVKKKPRIVEQDGKKYNFDTGEEVK